MATYRVINTPDDFSLQRSVVYREIRLANIKRITLALLILTVFIWVDVIGTVFRARIYYSGPKEVTPDELAAISSPLDELTSFSFPANYEESEEFDAHPGRNRLMYSKDGSCYLSVIPYSYVSLDIKELDGIRYELADIGGVYMLIKRSTNTRLDRLTGTVGYLPEDIRQIAIKNTDVDPERIVPLFMDGTAQVFSDVNSLVAFDVVIILLWGLWFFFIMRTALNVQRHPAWKRIFVCPGSVEENIRQIDLELTAEDCYSVRGVTVTKNWTLRRKLLSFSIEHADQP